ncbi:sperm acrosome membrane-associated protein 6 [Gymnodraco acuticeps]|uniref:Sperm acrosome membrane-associated protein 6 n=1 Tax=Gymnodraco acuticeps TaxID=8218 RepID=A0A6P8V2N4_GYMAC|nr:sperm acrosome membrane-associated protein 6 [Gymnodraco acuticeps]
MCKSALCLVCVSLLLGPSLSCYQCFVEVQDSLRLCWGHILTEHNVRNVDSCFRKLDRIFNNHERVIEAGRVGKGYDKQLKELLDGEILPMVEEFDKKRNNDTVYEERLQTAADNFIAAASKLPRGETGLWMPPSMCCTFMHPSGFQSAGAVYNCITCQYDSCELPLDCPVKEVTAMENSRSQMWCEVPFHLPGNIEVIWRFAEEVKTQQVDQFKEVTAGLDTLYSIPSSSLQHVGTYQCEIYSGQRSIVRLYFYLTVTPQVVAGHTELQEIFDLSLLPGGRFLPAPAGPPHSLTTSPLLLTACLTALLLLLFLSMGALYWSVLPDQTSHAEQEEEYLGL